MEKLGYVERRQKPGDRKQVFIHLTPFGRSLRDKLVPLAEEVNRVAVHGVDPAQLAATRSVLLAVIENLARDEARHEGAERRVPSTRAVARMGRALPRSKRARP
jgi:DNA-binding MarR family transcriptional regulator